MNAAGIAHALENSRASGGGFVCCCPAHEDRDPSLSLRDAGSKVLVHCHAGCSQPDVIAALKSRGLWDVESEQQLVCTYDYLDEHGQKLYEICRYEYFDQHGKRHKTFKQRYPDGHGGWIWQKHRRQVLYSLPAVVRNQIIFIVEGEKDVETLRDFGFTATTSAGGARSAWLPQYNAVLRGKEIIIVPDDDQVGWHKAGIIVEGLFDVAASVALLKLPPPDNKDISQWLGVDRSLERNAAGEFRHRPAHSETELIELVERINLARD